eukprot:4894855-Prymnesium_polylepis.1
MDYSPPPRPGRAGSQSRPSSRRLPRSSASPPPSALTAGGKPGHGGCKVGGRVRREEWGEGEVRRGA